MRYRPSLATIILMFCAVCLLHSTNGQENADVLKYRLNATPGNIQVNRMPSPNPPRSYEEKLSFEVVDPTRTDFKGSAPTCKTFDMKVVPIEAPEQPVWVWSKGRRFCQHVTPVKIGAGKSWKQMVVWKFTTADIRDGKYRAIATFVPNNRTTYVDFEITSVQ